MLVLSRKVGERIIIDGPCEVMVVGVRGDKVRIGIVADRSVAVDRAEVREQKEAKRAASAA